MTIIQSRLLPLLGAGLIGLGAALPAAAESASAEYGPEDLGGALTPSGAVAAANEDGSIPQWSGKWQGVPPHISHDGKVHADPYADDEPLYTITADNVDEYAELLSPGQKALFEAYPESFEMHVYPTRRDFRPSDRRIENMRRNAEQAELTHDGEFLRGAYGGPAFPIPESGLHIIYNVISATAPWLIEAPQVSRYVHANGSVTESEVLLKTYSPYARGNDREGWEDGDIFAYSLSEELAPPRNKGRTTLSANTYDFRDGSGREAWQYDPGTRRVRKTPDVQHDYPVPQGPRVVDEQNGFNGSPHRFEWKLVGRQELIVPFHNYRMESRELDYEDFIGPIGHPNPEHIRYERRRVWVIEGTLKEGTRHIYSKRRFYVEEDSWHKVVADMYDKRGELWRVSTDAMIYAYDAGGYYNNVSMYHDLDAGSYSIEKLSNEKPTGARFNFREPRPGEFSPEGLRRQGR